MPLEDIPVIQANDGGLSGNAPVLLRETAEHLRRLLETGEPTAIDLQALPLTPRDRVWLKERLGQGEIGIQLRAEGESTLDETACPGVWWVTHRNEKGVTTSEFIEVAHVPELAKAHPEDIKIGLEHLELLISDLC
ncbi:MAG TPA: hydrogenase expression/formation protein [Thiobacillaceae bacterium]|nr:hydrogenase expression/formation protein [Thiobacillaceae bacterium]HNA80885.1 hydrogenase expression/formation protein [Thiobacillaceae bacterium]HNF89468.1 hydrogenase expression/formation protein [Thiobacillaceae bacterium]HNH88337.1 hydrogenase expression/formation protein [Thiobacillaceae bacterium]HNI08274.1 hydrogenase expression/formation protein [Thiobacillaceae bacterium]